MTAQWALLHKEFRALLPWWTAIVGVIVMCAIVVGRDHSPPSADLFVAVGFFTYGIGALLLGALSMGHDYQHRTMAMLLTQPVSRARVFAAKGFVLTVLLAMLMALGTVVLELSLPGITRRTWHLDWLSRAWLPLAAGLGLAPGLALICSGPLAATVFSTALLLGTVSVAAQFDVPLAALWPSIAALTVVGGVLTWRAFERLEVASATHTEMAPFTRTTSRTATVQAPRTHHPLRLLVVKELWLQQLALVIAGLYTILWMATRVADRVTGSHFPNELDYAIANLFGVVISVTVGALASAEERRLGTTDWHTLLPTSARTQWVVKAGVALALAVGLASIVPGLLSALAPNPLRNYTFHPGLAASLCVIGLYTSSLSRSGVHALLAAPVVVVATWFFIGLLAWPWLDLLLGIAETLQPILGVDDAFARLWERHSYVWVAGGAGLLLVFAGANHRTVDRSRARLARQAVWVIAYIAGALLLTFIVTAMGMLSRAAERASQ
jgi:hypothetical protein